MPEKLEPALGVTTPREFFADGKGQQDAAPWGKDNRVTAASIITSFFGKQPTLVSLAMNDTATVVSASSDFTKVQNSDLYLRPDWESHLIFFSHWVIQAQTGATAPSAGVTIELQAWLNQYHVLISPTGFANDWNITLPPIGANQTWEFSQSFLGGIFNVEFRPTPQFHLIDFRYRVQTLPAGWSQITMKPRLSAVFAIPSMAVTFVGGA